MKCFGFFLLFSVLAFSACKKNNAQAPGFYNDQRLILGYTPEFHPSIRYEYIITDNALYVDSNINSATGVNVTSLISDPVKYQLALPLLNTFPQYLANGVGGYISDGAFPVSTGTLVLEYTRNGHTVIWNIPSDTLYIPTQIRAYVQQVNTIFSQL